MRTITVEPDHLLSPLMTVRCFWWPRCRHSLTDHPEAAHEAMERHYDAVHGEDIGRMIGGAA